MNLKPERRFETLVSRSRLPQVLKALQQAHPYEEPGFDILPCEIIDKNIGLGVRGVLPGNGLALAEFAQQVRDSLNAQSLRVVHAKKKLVKRVAVLGGSGGGDIPKVPYDIDCYVTGDVKYHDADLARERGLPVIDAGHSPTELPIVNAIATRIEQRHPGVKATPWLEPDLFSILEN